MERRRLFIDAIDTVDARRRRSLSELPLEAFERCPVSFRSSLDVSARQVLHPPEELFAGGGVVNKISEPDALYTAADEIPSRDTHAEGTPIIDYERQNARYGRRRPVASVSRNSASHASGSAYGGSSAHRCASRSTGPQRRIATMAPAAPVKK